jgi:alpha-D-ribose 1-methylphosphonate 5-triphosphate synthase subunit PhnH
MNLDLPGFADPVADAQRSFRAVLDAMAHPGRVHRVGDGLRPPAPLMPAAAALLLTLVDAETPLWLAPEFAPARDWIIFHCGGPISVAEADASFAIASQLPAFANFCSGSDEAPQASATLILQLAGFGSGKRLRLAGPGLREPTTIAVDGLPQDFANLWSANHALYPRGLDLLLVAGADLVALPRSLRIEAA